jgi:HD-like signal output (HDOD) protein
MRSIKEWAAYLEKRELPVLRHTAVEIARLARRADKTRPAEVAKAILHDPMLTLRVLKQANRPRSSHFGSEITTVENAVVVIGITPLFQHLSRLSIIEDMLQGNAKALDEVLHAFSAAFHAAYLARDWAILRKDIQSEEVYVAGLLHDFARMAMSCMAPDEMLKAKRLLRKEGIGAVDAEARVFGFPLSELQEELARLWRLPDLTLSLMDPKNAERPRTRQVLIAMDVVRRGARGWYDEKLEADYEALAELLRITPDEAAAVVHVDCAVAARGWRRYGVPPLAAWLPMEPGELPEEEDEEEELPPMPQKTSAEERHPRLHHSSPHPEVLKRSMNEISAHFDGTLNLHDMLSLVMQGMHEGIGLERVVFALMAPDRNSVRAKYVVGAAADSPLRNFAFSTQTPNLFARLLTKVQGIWVSAVNRAQLGGLLGEDLLALTEGEDFFAMSVYVHNKAVGLFYADKKDSDEPLDEQCYIDFKTLALLGARGLAHLAKR